MNTTRRSIARLASAGALIFAFGGTQISAQVTPPSDGRTVTVRDTANPDRHQTLFTYRDGILGASLVGLTFAMFPADRSIAERIQDEDLRKNTFLERSAKGVEWITTPGTFFIGGGMYAVGRILNKPDLADIGWHGTEAVLLSSAVTSLLKGTLGRARPYVTGDTNPSDFQFGRGFGRGPRLKDFGSGDYQSFPSGHTTTAFAAAAAVTSETRRLYPGAVWFVAPVLYGGASLVGLSRMYHNNHWASDVILGAAVGTFGGLKTVRYSHAHPDNKLDRFILKVTATPNADGGALLAFSISP